MTNNVKIIVALFVLFACIACSGNEEKSAAIEASPATNKDVLQKQSSDEARRVLARSRDAIKKYQLTTVSEHCIKIEIENETPLLYEMSVYELHNEKCGGDPQTQPRLFGIEISRLDAKLLTDARSDSGEFESLE